VGILWRIRAMGGVSASASASPLVRDAASRVDRRWAHGIRVAEDRRRLDCTFLSMGHGLRGAVGIALRPDDALRTPASSALHRRARERSPSVFGIEASPAGRRGPFHPDWTTTTLCRAFWKVFREASMFAHHVREIRSSRDVVTQGDRCVWCDGASSAGWGPPPGWRRLHAGGAPSATGHRPCSNRATPAASCLRWATADGKSCCPAFWSRPGLEALLAQQPRGARCCWPTPRQPQEQLSGTCEVVYPGWVIFSGDGRWSLPETQVAYRAWAAACSTPTTPAPFTCESRRRGPGITFSRTARAELSNRRLSQPHSVDTCRWVAVVLPSLEPPEIRGVAVQLPPQRVKARFDRPTVASVILARLAARFRFRRTGTSHGPRSHTTGRSGPKDSRSKETWLDRGQAAISLYRSTAPATGRR